MNQDLLLTKSVTTFYKKCKICQSKVKIVLTVLDFSPESSIVNPLSQCKMKSLNSLAVRSRPNTMLAACIGVNFKTLDKICNS